jgi:hypothetical protein
VKKTINDRPKTPATETNCKGIIDEVSSKPMGFHEIPESKKRRDHSIIVQNEEKKRINLSRFTLCGNIHPFTRPNCIPISKDIISQAG